MDINDKIMLLAAVLLSLLIVKLINDALYVG